MLLRISILLLICGFLISGIPEKSITTGKLPKNIILIIGDGMGLSQISASMYSAGNKTILEEFPVTGLIATQSYSNLITDSGAGATAFACGCKTFNGAIGVDAQKHPCTTLLEVADSLGRATGLAVNCSVTHATPASFVAHVPDRAKAEDIALWFLRQPVDFLVGSGAKYFHHRKNDNRNLLQEMAKTGVNIVMNRYDSIPSMPATDHPFFWLTGEDEPPSALLGRAYLPEVTRMATSFLSRRAGANGFFLMVEGSQIDWAGHANERDQLLAEMKDFEAATAAALAFAKSNSETLVVVTADHETGGMSILQGSDLDSLDMKFTTKGHTASLIPVFAYGPGSEKFGGLYQNTGIFEKILALMK